MEDPIANVGIKQSQKEKISELISKDSKYKSINEFVQIAASNLIDTEFKKQEPNKGTVQSILAELGEFNLNLIKDELTGIHKLNDNVISLIKRLKDVMDAYRSYEDTLTKLLLFRNLKNLLNAYFSYFENRNEPEKLGISKYKLAELKSLIEKFIVISTQEVKG